MATANANVKKVLNRLNQKISSVGGVIDSWSDGNGNWWRKYSDGWLEQGGIVEGESATITFPVSYKSANYTVLAFPNSGVCGWNYIGLETKNKKTTSVAIMLDGNDNAMASFCWFTCGF